MSRRGIQDPMFTERGGLATVPRVRGTLGETSDRTRYCTPFIRLLAPSWLLWIWSYKRLKEAQTKNEELHCHTRMPVKQKPTTLNLLARGKTFSSMTWLPMVQWPWQVNGAGPMSATGATYVIRSDGYAALGPRQQPRDEWWWPREWDDKLVFWAGTAAASCRLAPSGSGR